MIVFFCFLGNAESFAQRRHPAENTKAARSWAMDFRTDIEFKNETGKTVKIYWLDSNAGRYHLFDLADGQSKHFDTYVSYMYLVTDDRDNALGMYASDAQPRIVRLGDKIASAARPPRESDSGNDEDDYADSPKGNYDTTPVTICSNQEIPRGFVITAVGNNFNCPNWNAVNKNTYTIQRPSRTEQTIICGGQQIPRGYVITAAGNNFNCSNWNAVNKNTYTIRRPRETENICSVSDVPRGYVVTGDYNDFNCPNWNAVNNNGKRLKRIR